MKYKVYTHSDNKWDVLAWLEERDIEFGGVMWITENGEKKIIFQADDSQMMIELFNEDDAALFKLAWC